MATLGSSLCPPSSFLFSYRKQTPKFRVINSSLSSSDHNNKVKAQSKVSEKNEKTTTSFTFKNLTETFWVDVQRAEERPLRVKVRNYPSRRGEAVENVAIRVELSNGCVGWGEAVAAAAPENVAVKAREACEFLRLSSPATLSCVFDEVSRILHAQEFASVRAGVEMALIDAVANSIDVPLWRLFGGVSNSLTTTVTIPCTSPNEASILASNYFAKGFNTIRFNMGSNLSKELEVINAIRVAQPQCLLIIDANGKYSSEEAISVLEKLHEMSISPVLFEQPVREDDWNGLAKVSRVARERFGVNVGADESCQTLLDIQRVARDDIVDVINIKLAKFGVLGTLRIIDIARNSGLNLAIDSMVETRLATGFAGHLACGLGCFKYINLDAPFMLSEDPVFGGYEVTGPVYKFTNARGQGGFLKQDLVFQ